MQQVTEKARGILSTAKNFFENEGHKFEFAFKSIHLPVIKELKGNITHTLTVNGKSFDFVMNFEVAEIKTTAGSIKYYGMSHKKTLKNRIEHEVTFAEIQNVFDDEQLLKFCKAIVSEFRKNIY